MNKITLQFSRLDGDTEDVAQKYHVPIARTWQEAPNDFHVQFESAGDNFFPTYNERTGMYEVKYLAKLLAFGHMGIQDQPEVGSCMLSSDELKRFWFSPNMSYVTVSINGKKHTLPAGALSYEEIAALAYPGDLRTFFTCTYGRARGPKPEGSLTRGQKIQLGENTRISIADTSNA